MLDQPLSPFEIEAMLLSLKVGFWSTLGVLPVAILLAWVLARHEFPGKSVLDAVLHLPLVLPPVSIGFILLILFGRQGLIGDISQLLGADKLVFAYSMAGLFTGYVYFSIPRVILTVMAATEKLDAPSNLRKLRREIARMLTIQTQREQAKQPA